MADIFGGVEPPRWLTNMTAQQPGQLGRIIGEIVGGLGTSAEVAIDKATNKQAQGVDSNWIKEMPGSIQEGFFDARMNLQNPMWKMQVQQAQLNMAQQGIAIKNQQSLIDARATKLRMQEHDQDVLPKWMQDHPTWESRQDAEPPQLFTTEGQRMYRDVQLGDAANIKHKSVVEGINSYSKSVAELQKINAVAAAPFAVQIGKVPSPQMQAQLDDAIAKAREKAKMDAAPVPMDMQVGDKIVHGFVEKGTFHEFKALDKPEKISPGLQSELTYGRERVLAIEKALLDPINRMNPARVAELQNQLQEARKFYNRKVKDSGAVGADKPKGAATAAPAAAPATATPNPKDPLSLF